VVPGATVDQQHRRVARRGEPARDAGDPVGHLLHPHPATGQVSNVDTTNAR
jgi:hypothetical protein